MAKRLRIITYIILSCAYITSLAQESVFVRGIVRDSISAEGLSYASVRVVGAVGDVVCDEQGMFELLVSTEADSLRAFCQGYKTHTIPLWTNSLNIYDINLSVVPTELREVVVNKQRYSKKNNPAVDFARKLREGGAATDPRRLPWYSYDRYERITMGVNNFDATDVNHRFNFLSEHVDTSHITGKPVLTMSVNEKASSVAYHNGTRRELVKGMRQRGIDEVIEQANMQTILSDALREVDLYDGDMKILRNSFVSPLSRLAPDFYRFYLVDTVAIADKPCVVLAFYPRGHTGNGFAGHVYVDAQDTLMSIRRVEMRTPGNTTLNFIDKLSIIQDFDRAPDGSRLKVSDELAMELTFLPGTPSIYVGRILSTHNHSFERSINDELFNDVGEVHIAEGASNRDDDFWESHIAVPAQEGEKRIDLLMTRLRGVPLYYWGEKIVKRMFTGYWPTAKNSRFDIGPLNTLASYNSLEGMRFRLGGMTTAHLSPHWFGRGYAAYGLRDQKWKYSAEVEYSFNRKEYHSREFPIHSLRLRHRYDVNRIGANYLFTSPDNFVLSWTRMPARLDTYRRESTLEYTLELRNNFSLVASVELARQEPSPFVPFTNTAGESIGHYNQTIFGIELRYAPGEKFYQMRSGRFPINFDAPTFVLRHRFSPKGFMGSRWAINKTEFNFSKRFWLSFLGKLDIGVGGGHVWSASPFPELLIPNANLSYTIQPQSFALMTPMEFINTTYASWDLVYHAEGLLFNNIPGVRKLGLKEIIGFRGIWGKRNNQSTPSADNDLPLFPVEAPARIMHNKPYMEMSAGLDNVFKCLRIEYVWRLNYRHEPYEIDRNGIRVALHVTF